MDSMKFFKICAVGAFIVSHLFFVVVFSKTISPVSIRIRVLLREYDTRKNHSFTVETHGGVVVHSVPQTKLGYVCEKPSLRVKIKKNELYFQE